VLFGRDFEDEPIPLCQVIEEMGEVTIRGKILPNRPIRARVILK